MVALKEMGSKLRTSAPPRNILRSVVLLHVKVNPKDVELRLWAGFI